MTTTVKIQLSNGSPCPTTSTTTPIVIPTTSATTTTSNSDLLAGQYEKQKTQKVQTVESIKSIPALIKAEEVEKFVTGPTNPLHDISRPVQTTNIQDTDSPYKRKISRTPWKGYLSKIAQHVGTTFPTLSLKKTQNCYERTGFHSNTMVNRSLPK